MRINIYVWRQNKMLAVYFTLLLTLIKAQDCPSSGREAGLQVLRRDNVDIPAAVNRAHIMLQKGGINCYGVIKEWEFYQENGTTCHTMQFQIWRKTFVSDQYLLVGYNDFTCDPTVVGNVKVNIPEIRQIAVSPDDIIGWTIQSIGDTGLHYDNTSATCANGVCGQVLEIDQDAASCTQVVGTTCDWKGLELYQDFSIKVHIYKLPSPEFSNLPAAVTIGETTENITTLYTVRGTHISNTVSSQGNVMTDIAPVTYSLGSHLDVFYIDSATGDINTISALDYESVSEYDLTVTITALESTTTSTLTVKVTDVNELHSINLPTSMTLSVLDTPENTEVFTVTSTDDDSPQSTVRYYFTSVVPSDLQPFAINYVTGLVYTTSSLIDWTGPTQYNLSIQATDYTHTTGPEILTITLTDLKAKPEILYLDQPVSITIPEDVQAGSDIFQLYGTGPDIGELEYAITGVEPTSGSDYFTVDTLGGLISVTSEASFDVSVTDVYILNVTVKDSRYTSNVYPLMAQLDWRNRAPEFNQSEYTIIMKENSTEIAPLLNITTYDRDTNYSLPVATPDTVTCHILPGIGAEFFAFPDCENFFVTDVVDIDNHEEYVTLNLTIMVNDSFGFSDTASVIITVEDQNDNVPTFSSSSYAASVAENTPGGISLLTVRATDNDYTAVNSKIAYNIQNINGNVRGTKYFQINSTTGDLSSKQPVDYETYRSISFEVVARDSGSPSLASSVSVRITITDENDNRPVFSCTNKEDEEYYEVGEECFYNLDMRSDTVTGYTIMTVTATDADVITPTPFYYLLEQEWDWSLSSSTGALSVQQELEDDFRYALYCYARDQGDPELISGPLVARVDSYEPWRYLIDITLDIPISSFNDTEKNLFLTNLRNFLYPWVAKIEEYQLKEGKTVVTVYAFNGNSTFQFSSLNTEKDFIWRYDMLGKLRKDIFGSPSDGLLGSDFAVFKPIKVMPTFIIWWIDTVEGIATMCALVFLFIVIVITIILCVCKKRKWCCFKEKATQQRKSPAKKTETVTKPHVEEHNLRYRTNGSAKRRVSIESLQGNFGLKY